MTARLAAVVMIALAVALAPSARAADRLAADVERVWQAGYFAGGGRFATADLALVLLALHPAAGWTKGLDRKMSAGTRDTYLALRLLAPVIYFRLIDRLRAAAGDDFAEREKAALKAERYVLHTAPVIWFLAESCLSRKEGEHFYRHLQNAETLADAFLAGQYIGGLTGTTACPPWPRLRRNR